MLSDWQVRKEERRKAYQRLHGVKTEDCVACSGTGVYDHNGSPPCGGCDGTGKVRRPRLAEAV